MRRAFRPQADRSAPVSNRNRRRRRQPGFDRLEGRDLLSATIVGLGDLGGGSSEAQAINNLGQVVGDSQTSSGQMHAFLYSDGTMTDIDSSSASSYATGINDSGQVAGNSIAAGSFAHAFRYSGGVMTDLGTLGGRDSFAYAINQSGEVAGYATGLAAGVAFAHAFVSSGGTMTDLGGLGYDAEGDSLDSYAYGINDSGQVVGYANVLTSSGSTTTHAFLDSGGVMTDLGAGDASKALGINDAGQVIGVWSSGYYVESHGVFTNLIALPTGINDNGDVVGYTQDGRGYQSDPYLYTQGKMIDLNSILPAGSGWTLTNAAAINNHDQIVGAGTYQGHQEAYLLSVNGSSPTIPTITWANPVDIVYGTALGASQLDATASVPGRFTYAPAAGTILHAGDNQALEVTFTPTDTTDFAPASATVEIDVARATPTIAWANPADLTAGTPLSSAQLDATASVPGSFAYTPAPGAVLNAGAGQSLEVTFTPTDAADYTAATATVHINVAPAIPLQVSDIASASRTNKGLTAITLTFDEALDGGVVRDQALFSVLGAVKKHRKTVYSKAVRIKGIGFDGGTRVTIDLAKPYKGAVKVIVHGGILAADGAATRGDSSVVVD